MHGEVKKELRKDGYDRLWDVNLFWVAKGVIDWIDWKPVIICTATPSLMEMCARFIHKKGVLEDEGVGVLYRHSASGNQKEQLKETSQKKVS